jgi:tape measure domain-containing protein
VPAEVASASVALIPTFKGAAREIERVLGVPLAQAGTRAGTSYGSAFSRSATSILDALPIGKLSGLAAAGNTLVAGFNRFSAIDNAKAKLDSFGYSTSQIAAVLDSANQAALGTAFSLGDLATAASSALASGVSQGAGLTKYLGLITDAAAATNSAVSDISFVFNQVQAAGRAYTQDLNQVVARGIPIWALLADQYQVNTTELRDMVSAGQVDSKAFFDAIDTYIGGSAKNVDSLASAFSNTQAAIGRAGAGSSGEEGLIGPVLKEAKAGLKDFTEALNTAQPAFDAIGSNLGNVVSVARGLPAPVQAGALALLALTALRNPLGALNGRVMSLVDSARNFGSSSVQFETVARSVEGSNRKLGDLVKTASSGRTFVAGFGGSIKEVSAATNLMNSGLTKAKGAILGAFGGPVGLGVTVAITAITAALTAWQGATQAQKDAVDALTQSLDANTGAVTGVTRDTIFKDLNAQGAIDSVEKLGLSTRGYLDAITAAGPAQDAFRKRLQDIIAYSQTPDAVTGQLADPAAYQAATRALAAFDQQTRNLGTSQDEYAKAARAGVGATEESGDAANHAGGDYDKFSDSVAAAFDAFSSKAQATDALDDLANSIIDNGNSLDTLSAKGAANFQAIQAAVSALAAQSGDDQVSFVGRVSGLLDALRGQGVDVTNVVRLVKASLTDATAQKYALFLDGSQAIKEARNTATAALRAAQALLAARQASAGDNSNGGTGASERQVARLRAQIAEIDRLASAANSASSSYRGVASSAAQAAAASSAGAAKTAKATEKATKAQKAYTKSLRDNINATDFLDSAGVALSFGEVGDQYDKFIAKIKVARKRGKITKAERDDLVGEAKDWKTSARDATQAVKDIFEDADSWLNPSSLSSDAQNLIDKVLDAYNAKGISAKVRDSLVTSVTDADAQMQSISKQREELATQIDDANQKLQDAIAARDDFKQSIIDGYKGLGDLSKLNDVTEQQVTTFQRIGDRLVSTTSTQKTRSAATLVANLQSKVGEARKFKAAYEKLTGAGLNPDSLKSLVSDFIATGDASLAESLVSGGSSVINDINAGIAELGTLGTGLGDFASNNLYQAGVDTAQGFLDGLQSQDAALKTAYESIADNLVATVKKKLGIASPSKVMAKLAGFTSAGWNDNLSLDAVAPDVVGPDGVSPRANAYRPEVAVYIGTERLDARIDYRVDVLGSAADLAGAIGAVR